MIQKAMYKYGYILVALFVTIDIYGATINGKTDVVAGEEETYSPRSFLTCGGQTCTWEVTNGRFTNGATRKSVTAAITGNLTGSQDIIWDNIDGIGTVKVSSNACTYVGGYDSFGNPILYSRPSVNASLTVNISTNKTIDGETFSSAVQYNYKSIAIKNVVINSGADVIFNGTSVVSIFPDFHAKEGSKVRIYNGLAARAAMLNENQELVDDEAEGVNKGLTDLRRATLYQNIPNPSNGQTKIGYFVPEMSESAMIQILDMNGTLIKTLVIHNKGEGEFVVQSSELSPGIYIYSLIIDGKIIDSKRMSIVN